MSSILFGRVRRLEQHLGDCSLCHGEGRLVIEHADPEMAALHGVDPVNTDRAGCPECGRKQIIRIKYVKETIIKR